ncbi:MAG: hypothetical protein IT210_24610 [Armatimonadetes bacterium]|nr:hypothetical protein [Armatimonadota bacterium]
MDNIRRFEEFRDAVGKPYALRVEGEVFPFTVPPVSLRQVVAEAREEPQARIATGTRGNALAESLRDYRDEYLGLPLEEALEAPVHLTLFDLGRLGQPGGALWPVLKEVFYPLIGLWEGQGMRWRRAWPILFLSGPGCSTNYHWDPDDVFFIMLSGHKRFSALNDPERWLTPDMLRRWKEHPEDLSDRVRPEGLQPEDIRTFDMEPGQALWNPKHAPHWVNADDSPAFSLSVAFTDAAFEPSPERIVEVG